MEFFRATSIHLSKMHLSKIHLSKIHLSNIHFRTTFFLKSYLLIMVITGAPTSVLAAEYPGWYAGFRAGYSSNEKSCKDYRISCDKTDAGYGIFAGYDFTSRYGVELSWNDIGDSKAQYQTFNLDGKLQEIDVSLKISQSLNERVVFYGKIGAAYWDGEVTGGPWTESDSGVRPLVGAGVEFPLASQWSARVEYQYIDKVGNRAMGHANPNFLGLSLIWHFSKLSPPPIPTPELSPAPKPEPQIVAVKEPEPQFIEQRITVDEQLGGPLFEFNQAEIRNTAAIDQVLKILIDNPGLTAVITGHTDSRGKADYNQRLSEKRAAVVADYLQKNGVDSQRIKTSGVGASAPVADNQTDIGRAKNRRVEFVISGTKTNP
jgi:OOP family OmpA-OmpF porin